MIRIEIPGKPVPKARARVTRSGHTYTPKTTLDYERVIAMGARVALAKWQQSHGTWDMSGTYMLTVTVVPYQSYAQRKRGRDARVGDWDNYGKIVSDALNGIVWHDDRQVAVGVVQVAVPTTRPGIVVTVSPVERPCIDSGWFVEVGKRS